jgi:dTDP-4-dehydrorhamnose 3,5-epimerase
MEIKERKIKGVFEIVLKPFYDERGFFMRTFDIELFEKAGINLTLVQENHSLSKRKHIIRGLHFQFPPFAETKIVRCIRGAIWDVFVDLRKGSDYFGQWDSIELTEENKKMILIPRGFAHGFCTLSDISEVIYKVDNFYSKEKEGGIIWNDPDLKIEWPTKNPILSDKDKHNMPFQEFIENCKSVC